MISKQVSLVQLELTNLMSMVHFMLNIQLKALEVALTNLHYREAFRPYQRISIQGPRNVWHLKISLHLLIYKDLDVVIIACENLSRMINVAVTEC